MRTDPVQYMIWSFRAAWNRVSVGFVFVVGRREAPQGRSVGRTVGRGRRFAPPFGRGFGAGLNELIPMFTGRLKSWLDAISWSEMTAGCNHFG